MEEILIKILFQLFNHIKQGSVEVVVSSMILGGALTLIINFTYEYFHQKLKE